MRIVVTQIRRAARPQIEADFLRCSAAIGFMGASFIASNIYDNTNIPVQITNEVTAAYMPPNASTKTASGMGFGRTDSPDMYTTCPNCIYLSGLSVSKNDAFSDKKCIPFIRNAKANLLHLQEDKKEFYITDCTANLVRLARRREHKKMTHTRCVQNLLRTATKLLKGARHGELGGEHQV